MAEGKRKKSEREREVEERDTMRGRGWKKNRSGGATGAGDTQVKMSTLLCRNSSNVAVNLSVKFARDNKSWCACFSETPESCKNLKPMQTKLNKLFSK